MLFEWSILKFKICILDYRVEHKNLWKCRKKFLVMQKETAHEKEER